MDAIGGFVGTISFVVTQCLLFVRVEPMRGCSRPAASITSPVIYSGHAGLGRPPRAWDLGRGRRHGCATLRPRPSHLCREVPERSNGAVYRLPTSANGRRFGKCLIYAAASARGAKPTWG